MNSCKLLRHTCPINSPTSGISLNPDKVKELASQAESPTSSTLPHNQNLLLSVAKNLNKANVIPVVPQNELRTEKGLSFLPSSSQLLQSQNQSQERLSNLTEDLTPAYSHQSEKLLPSAARDEPSSSLNATQPNQRMSPGADASSKSFNSGSYVKLIKITKLVDTDLRKTGSSVSGQSAAALPLSRIKSEDDKDSENLPLSRRKIKPSKFL